MLFILICNNKKIYELNIKNFDYINIYKIHNILKFWNFDNNDIKKINIYINGEMIINVNYKFNNITNVSIIFESNDTIIDILNDLLKNNSTDQLENNITNILLHDNILTDNIIQENNNTTLELFTNSDFITLLKIYNKNPQVFEILYKYTQNANISESFISTKTINNLSTNELNYYKHLCDKIYNLDIITDKNIIMQSLIKHSGHLNLTLRDLLNKEIT